MQNLTYNKLPTWRHGRAWPKNLLGKFEFEWSIFHNPSLFFTLRKSGNKIKLHIGLLLFSLYSSREFKREFKRCELSANWFEGSIQLHLFTTDDDYVSKRPWHRNCVHLHVMEWFTGKYKYNIEYGPEFQVVIPLPEGSYKATAKSFKSTHKNRFRTIIHEGFDFKFDPCLPFSGKGENSWDCGDDGLCGWGPSGTLEECIGKTVTSVLESRKRYGNASWLNKDSVVFAKIRGAI